MPIDWTGKPFTKKEAQEEYVSYAIVVAAADERKEYGLIDLSDLTKWRHM